jgi:hypothetical protein
MTAPSDRTVNARDLLGNAGVRKLAGRLLHQSAVPTRHTLIRWRAKEGFPEPIAAPDGYEIWSAQDVRAWLERRRSL